MGAVQEQSECNRATTHLPVFSLDLERALNLSGHLDCHACRGPFLFYDKLRYVALPKLNENPIRLAEISDVMVTIHQWAHVMQATHTKTIKRNRPWLKWTAPQLM